MKHPKKHDWTKWFSPEAQKAYDKIFADPQFSAEVKLLKAEIDKRSKLIGELAENLRQGIEICLKDEYQ